MLGCKPRLECFFYDSFLPRTISFVDRDILMRFLGYGIGHKNQTKSAVSSDRGNDESDKGGDTGLKSHNMAQEDCRQCAPLRRPFQKVHNTGVAADAQGDDDDDSSSQDDSGVESDLDDDLDGNF